MKTKKGNRIKAPEILAPQTLAEAEGVLARIGTLQRQVQALEIEMNEELAATKAAFETRAAPITELLEAEFGAFQVWAEAHRSTVLDKNRKSAKLATGELGWRTSPAAVRITGKDAVIAALKKLGLKRFVRTKEEVDKDAIRKEADAVKHIKGISITKSEEFWIKPFESEIERSRSSKVG